jgi:hypothetical protein
MSEMGMNTSASRPGKVKEGGITPTMVVGRSSSVTVFPTIDGSAL